MADEWAGVINATAPKYMAGASDLTIRKRLLLSLLRQKGNIKFNENSYQCTWDVECFEQPVESIGDGGVLNFQRHDLLRQLTVDWRGYYASDIMTGKEKLMNDGDVAIVKRYDRIIPSLLRSMNHTFHDELFIDGYAGGNENRLHGLESFMGTGTTVAADKVAEPSDTYGGLATNLGDQGGNWSNDLTTSPNANEATDWPNGTGDSEYDFLAPKIINYSSTAWVGASNTTWRDTGERCMRQAEIWSTHTGGSDARPDLFLLAQDLFYEYQTSMEGRVRINVEHKGSQDLGFDDVLNQNGVAIQSSYEVPAGVGYGINCDMMELCSLDSVLFGTRGPDYDIKTDAWLFKVGFWGNARYQPKFFTKLAAIA